MRGVPGVSTTLTVLSMRGHRASVRASSQRSDSVTRSSTVGGVGAGVNAVTATGDAARVTGEDALPQALPQAVTARTRTRRAGRMAGGYPAAQGESSEVDQVPELRALSAGSGGP
jgi:hypothetical protein